MGNEQDWTSAFGQWMPGLDFWKNLQSNAMSGSVPGMPPMPGMGSWATPTLSVEELDKRIQDLKSVQFWLEQNSRALAATVQALEVQKMTLSTLQGMNVNLADLAQAFMPKAATTASTQSDAAAPKASPGPEAAQADPAATSAQPGVDPLQLWNGLAQQFQTIASATMQEAMRHVPPAAASMAKATTQRATPRRAPAAKKSPVNKK
ncbi:hypothetical protein KIK84_05760 [Curvibacter sp. CHRR-16]|uniref:PhaM family polyhydroxyalkanoate granule multifunctional regulatory protein n=1 Tax=Curvibacter sp. CHRR-16 TaxID=2835872 RepID=UPI001BDABA71|nr:PhaM family polyhydroxyalkanoate granule multifunctional regulatory protein [Curvibacter sp. CHRR-16]MBT0569823.1 hypothetical protein [Curvibacter sp. CHRR-16]